MESVLSMNATPYYGFNNCGLLYATAEQSNPALAAQRALEIYNLRSRNAPIGTDSQQHASFPHPSNKRERKTQSNRSRTLYNKRLLVNARERERMKTLNKGFENLRNALPCFIADGHISKITTLRLAINYIRTLGAVLQDAASTEGETLVEQQPCSAEVNPLTNTDMEHLTNTDTTNVLPMADSNEVEKTYYPSFVPVPPKTE